MEGGLRGGEGRGGEEDRGGTETSMSHTVDYSSHHFGFLYLNSCALLICVYIDFIYNYTHKHARVCKAPFGTATQSTPLAPRSGQRLALLFIPLPPPSPPGCTVIMKQPHRAKPLYQWRRPPSPVTGRSQQAAFEAGRPGRCVLKLAPADSECAGSCGACQVFALEM